MISESILEILVCPQSKGKLDIAKEDLVSRVKQEVASGALKNKCGGEVKQPIDSLLICEESKLAYVISGGIPILLKDEALDVSKL